MIQMDRRPLRTAFDDRCPLLAAWLAAVSALAGLAVAALSGTWLGGRMLERISDGDFRKWTRWIVLAIGGSYLVRGALG
jgi:uncharacterized membrane protein YfcA